MKVLGLNASTRKEGNTNSLLAYALKIIEREKSDAELLHLSDFGIRSCSGSLGNTHTLQGILSGLSGRYGGIEPLIVGTALIATRNCRYPDAWREGGLIDDPANRQLIKKLAERLLSAMY